MLEPPGIALLARRVAVTHRVSRILFGSSGSELNAADEETRLRLAAGGRRPAAGASSSEAGSKHWVSAPPAHDFADRDSPDRSLGSDLPSPPVQPFRSGPAPSRLLGPRPSVLGSRPSQTIEALAHPAKGGPPHRNSQPASPSLSPLPSPSLSPLPRPSSCGRSPPLPQATTDGRSPSVAQLSHTLSPLWPDNLPTSPPCQPAQQHNSTAARQQGPINRTAMPPTPRLSLRPSDSDSNGVCPGLLQVLRLLTFPLLLACAAAKRTLPRNEQAAKKRVFDPSEGSHALLRPRCASSRSSPRELLHCGLHVNTELRGVREDASTPTRTKTRTRMRTVSRAAVAALQIGVQPSDDRVCSPLGWPSFATRHWRGEWGDE
jgi:hypothetical protein